MQPKSLKAFTAFVDGRGTMGRLDSGKLPTVKIKSEDRRDGGMDGSDPTDMGLEPLEAELVFQEYDPDILGQVGSSNVPITLRGSAEDEEGNKVPVVAEMRGLVTEADPSEWKAGEAAKPKIVIKPRYYRLTVGGREVHAIDIVNNVRRMNGVDQLAQRRRNLGV